MELTKDEIKTLFDTARDNARDAINNRYMKKEQQ